MAESCGETKEGKGVKVCNEFLLGADPEFVIRSKADKLALPMTYIRDPYFNSKLGYDHNGSVGECRPEPKYSSFKLVQEIRKIILKKSPEEFERLHLAGKWEAGGFKKFNNQARRARVSLGGHIHFGINARGPWEELSNQGKRIVSNLDQITTGLEDLDILSKSESRERRQEGPYGELGDVRFNGTNHFEYRSMCSWLYHPETAMVTLTLAKIVARFPISISRRFAEKHLDMQMIEDLIARGAQKHKDDDCLLVWERIINTGRKLQHDPEEDFREEWERLEFARGVNL